jgi:hypothetical protein
METQRTDRFSQPSLADDLLGGGRQDPHGSLSRWSSATGGSYVDLPTGTIAQTAGYYVIDKVGLSQLLQENVRVRQEISDLAGKLSELIDLIRDNYPAGTGGMMVLRNISRPQAKKEILQLFKKQQSLYYSDVADQLRLDLEFVVDICAELEREGKIKPKE